MKSNSLRDLRALVPVARAKPNGNCVEVYGRTYIRSTVMKEFPSADPSEFGSVMLQLFKRAYAQRISDKKRYADRIFFHIYRRHLVFTNLNEIMMKLNAILNEFGICITVMADQIRAYLGYNASFWRRGQIIPSADIVHAWKMVGRKENFLKIEDFLWFS